jgi:hypothetical protein
MPTVDNLRDLMKTMYPDNDTLSEHPMTAVGTVLLAAAIFGITEQEALVRFTGYPCSFIVAILFNLRGNRVLNNGSYNCSDWLSSDGAIADREFWDHIEAACGNLWLQDVEFHPVDTCQIYWNNKELS